jgi:hypothetical protein
MNKLLIKTFAKKVIEFLIYGPGYKAPEYAYVPITKTSDQNIYDDELRR